MTEFINDFMLAFLPLFVALDALGILPIFLSLTEELAASHRRRLVTEATLTALGISITFLAIGKSLFSILGITESDFRIAGGIVLLILAITDLLFPQNDRRRRQPEDSIGVVPVGIPLIMGPAALTTLLILVDKHGYGPTIASLVVNLVFVWLVFRNSNLILKVVGTSGSKAIAKVASLFLAGIAVMMIRQGITTFL